MSGRNGGVTRRALLKGAATLVTAGAMTRSTQACTGPILAYVGTYLSNGQGIYLFSMDPLTGALTQIKVAANIPNPSFLAIHPQGGFLYAVNEIGNFNGSFHRFCG